eukprot:scaffold242100_cov21-Prasinocladus_malaysianus.AAC.1
MPDFFRRAGRSHRYLAHAHGEKHVLHLLCLPGRLSTALLIPEAYAVCPHRQFDVQDKASCSSYYSIRSVLLWQLSSLFIQLCRHSKIHPLVWKACEFISPILWRLEGILKAMDLHGRIRQAIVDTTVARCALEATMAYWLKWEGRIAAGASWVEDC